MRSADVERRARAGGRDRRARGEASSTGVVTRSWPVLAKSVHGLREHGARRGYQRGDKCDRDDHGEYAGESGRVSQATPRRASSTDSARREVREPGHRLRPAPTMRMLVVMQLLHHAPPERAQRKAQRHLPSPKADGVAQRSVDASAHQPESGQQRRASAATCAAGSARTRRRCASSSGAMS